MVFKIIAEEMFLLLVLHGHKYLFGTWPGIMPTNIPSRTKDTAITEYSNQLDSLNVSETL
jgi:hypothetical protein